MPKNRIPRKLKKQLKALLPDPNKPSRVARAEDIAKLTDHAKVGDTVRVGQGKTDWQVIEVYMDKLELISAAGRKKYVPRTEIDTLTVVK